jgi:hypothetical protein
MVPFVQVARVAGATAGAVGESLLSFASFRKDTTTRLGRSEIGPIVHRLRHKRRAGKSIGRNGSFPRKVEPHRDDSFSAPQLGLPFRTPRLLLNSCLCTV